LLDLQGFKNFCEDIMSILGSVATSLRRYEKVRFAGKLLSYNGLRVAGGISVTDAEVIKNVFFDRLYAPGFPFYADATIVDIGAHAGFFSIFAKLYSGKNSKIFAIEPDTANFDRLRKNIEINTMHSITAVQVAIARSSGPRKLHIAEKQSVNHSLVKNPENHPYVRQEKAVEVQAYSLADFMKMYQVGHIDFLKMDCEGSEYDIIFTLKDIVHSISAVVLEFHDLKNPNRSGNALTRFFLHHGYRIVSYTFQKTPLPLQMGVLAVCRA
jgi:FkbM family methyltransferase